MRVTKSRLRVINAITINGSAFTIDELNSQLKDVGRATVFRTAKMLLASNIICRVKAIGGQVSYKLNDNWSRHHHHLICADCDRVQDFDSPVLEQEIERLFGNDIHIVNHEVSIYFKCRSCDAGQSNERRRAANVR